MCARHMFAHEFKVYHAQSKYCEVRAIRTRFVCKMHIHYTLHPVTGIAHVCVCINYVGTDSEVASTERTA